MRKFILIAAMVLVSATAQAGVKRGLTMAANDEQPAATDQAKPAETPKYVERPAAVTPAAQTTAAEPSKPVADKDIAAKAGPRKHKRSLTEARVIYELHRHGIYW
jgi:hypothetical protein